MGAVFGVLNPNIKYIKINKIKGENIPTLHSSLTSDLRIVVIAERGKVHIITFSTLRYLEVIIKNFVIIFRPYAQNWRSLG